MFFQVLAGVLVGDAISVAAIALTINYLTKKVLKKNESSTNSTEGSGTHSS